MKPKKLKGNLTRHDFSGTLLVMILRGTLAMLLFLISIPAFSQQQIEQAANYVSDFDKALTIRRVGLLPVTDNIEGIYARPLEQRLTELLKGSHQWDLIETKVVGQMMTPLDLEADPDQVKKLAEGTNADALLCVRSTRGPNGVTITLDLFLVGDGKLLLQESVKDYPQNDTKEIVLKSESLFKKLVQKMPYSGLVLSRQGNRVTVNNGKLDGLNPGTIISAILVVKANRHPKFNFLVSTEREVLGKIKIEKVDDSISFGIVVSEKARGAIVKDTKVTGLDFVKYEPTDSFLGYQEKELDPNDDANKLTFGTGAEEWLPVAPPTFGKVGLLAGVGSFVYNMSLENVGSLKAANNLFPSIRLDGEIWVTPEWNVITLIRQGVLTVGNPREGSTPDSLSIATARYSLYGARNFLLKGDFFGPKIQVFAGFTKYTAEVPSSTPLGLTSTAYSGFSLGLKGELPITDDNLWTLGASIEVFLRTSMAETPKSSGATNKNTVNSYSFYGNYKLSQRLRLVGSLDFEQYSTTFSDMGTRDEQGISATQRTTLIMGGIHYLF